MARNAILNPPATSLRCMFRRGHSPLNINMKFFVRVVVGIRKRSNTYSCSAICPCSSLLALKNPLLNEQIYNQPQQSALTNKNLIHILLFGHPELSFKPTVVIFTALFRFLEHNGRFKSLDWQSWLVYFLVHPVMSFALPLRDWFILFVRFLPFILYSLTRLDKRYQPSFSLSPIVFKSIHRTACDPAEKRKMRAKHFLLVLEKWGMAMMTYFRGWVVLWRNRHILRCAPNKQRQFRDVGHIKRVSPPTTHEPNGQHMIPLDNTRTHSTTHLATHQPTQQHMKSLDSPRTHWATHELTRQHMNPLDNTWTYSAVLHFQLQSPVYSWGGFWRTWVSLWQTCCWFVFRGCLPLASCVRPLLVGARQERLSPDITVTLHNSAVRTTWSYHVTRKRDYISGLHNTSMRL